MPPALEVAEIFRCHGEAYRQARAKHLGRVERRVMGAIEACRTAALGGHAERCADCGLIRIAYNSCRNRHCPKCQGLARAEWLAARQTELLPAPYFHVVFTLPAPVAEIAFQNKATVYALLFRTAAETLCTIAVDPRYLGAEIGVVAVLHTWGQNLHHHPHVHCVVPGGGLSPDGTHWIACRLGFLLPVRVLSCLYRRLFLEGLQRVFEAGKLRFFGALAGLASSTVFAQQLAALRRIDWVVYAKRPFGGPEQVLAYLGRYTHRIAISNSRLIKLEDGRVSFRWRDYRHHDKVKVMTLAADEFIRRFLLHSLPDGFHRIRHYGFLANGHRAAKLALCRQLLATPPPAPPPLTDYREHYRQLTGLSLEICPCCGGAMVPLGPLPRLCRQSMPIGFDSS
jgi:putative transposase/transposase-like zinc-binding protein